MDQLEKRKASLRTTDTVPEVQHNDSDVDEEDYDDLLDWRVKKV